MNTQLQVILDGANELSPRDQMLNLASIYKQSWTARLKAHTDGLAAIHDAICKFQGEILARQNELLVKHPELIMMSMEAEQAVS